MVRAGADRRRAVIESALGRRKRSGPWIRLVDHRFVQIRRPTGDGRVALLNKLMSVAGVRVAVNVAVAQVDVAVGDDGAVFLSDGAGRCDAVDSGLVPIAPRAVDADEPVTVLPAVNPGDGLALDVVTENADDRGEDQRDGIVALLGAATDHVDGVGA